MHVQEIRLQQILEGSKQYRVPLYQRTYSWTPKQLQRLWADIVELADARGADPRSSHFTGSLVLSVQSAGPGGSEFLVVDGQQRLTTLSVLIAALRDHIEATEPDAPQKVAQLHETYLADRFKRGDDRLKLLPTQADRDAFRAIVDGAIPTTAVSGVIDAYRFFRARLLELDDPEDPHDVDRVVAAVLDGLIFVSITADADDNVYRIFESLNNTGMRLTQGDLLRNYLFMRLEARSEEIYSSVWLPMQELIGTAGLESLIWMDLSWSEPDAKQGDIYARQSARLSALNESEVEGEVRRLARLAELFAQMRGEQESAVPEVQEPLSRLREWGNGATDPIVLKILSLLDDGAIEPAEAARALHILESFLVRRLLVSAPANALSRIFIRAAGELKTDDVAGSLHRYLSSGRKFFATDRQIADAVTTKPFYYSGRPQQRKTLLSWLERSIAGKEPAVLDAATIEHVMPQTLTDEWRSHLAEDLGGFATAEELHEAYLHTLANLTLSGYNSELSNSAFAVKRDQLKESGIALNRPIAAAENWGRHEMDARGEQLADLVVGIWVAPTGDVDLSDAESTWRLVAQITEALPPGSWTTYGDLAAVVGTHPVPLGSFLSRGTVPNAWRVLQSGGTVSPVFRWPDGSPFAGRDPIDALREDGIAVSSDGRADAAARVPVERLAALVGLEPPVRDGANDEDEAASSITFVLNGEQYELDRDTVSARLEGATPERISTYWVEVEGIRWPVKQAFALAIGSPDRRFQSWTARQRFSALGLAVGDEAATQIEAADTLPR